MNIRVTVITQDVETEVTMSSPPNLSVFFQVRPGR